jgi:hypothetical protein
MTQSIDATKLTLMLNELRLPTIKQLWPTFAERSDKEGWPAARFLSAITEHEIAERDRRRMERHLAEAKLLPGKTLDTFDFDVVPMISKAQVIAGSKMAPTCSCSVRPEGASHICRRRSGSRLSKRAGAYCSHGLQTSSRNCRSRAANLRLKARYTGSTGSTC